MARGHAFGAEVRQAIISEYISGVPLKEVASRHSVSPATVNGWLKEGSQDTKKTRTEQGQVGFQSCAAEKRPVCDGKCEHARQAKEKVRRLQNHILSMVSACIDA